MITKAMFTFRSAAGLTVFAAEILRRGNRAHGSEWHHRLGGERLRSEIEGQAVVNLGFRSSKLQYMPPAIPATLLPAGQEQTNQSATPLAELRTGNERIKVVPRSAALLNVTVPPCASVTP